MTLEEVQNAEADAFARALLMPEAMVRERVVAPLTEQRVVELAHEFQVTDVQMMIRLTELGLIRKPRAR